MVAGKEVVNSPLILGFMNWFKSARKLDRLCYLILDLHKTHIYS